MFGNRMVDARRRLNLTQKQVAEKANIQPASYSAYENNKKIPPTDIALRIANALGLSMDWLCGKDEIRQGNTYGAAARAIIAAYTILSEFKSTRTKLSVDEQTYDEDEQYPPDSYDVVRLKTEANELTVFFQKMLQYQKMSHDNESALEMYRAWLKGELEKLDEITIEDPPEEPYTPYENNDDNLPF